MRVEYFDVNDLVANPSTDLVRALASDGIVEVGPLEPGIAKTVLEGSQELFGTSLDNPEGALLRYERVHTAFGERVIIRGAVRKIPPDYAPTTPVESDILKLLRGTISLAEVVNGMLEEKLTVADVEVIAVHRMDVGGQIEDHQDWTPLSFHYGSKGGNRMLEVHRRGKWYEVAPTSGALCFTGKKLAMMSQYKFAPLQHRVRPVKGERYSAIASFFAR